MTTVIQIQQLQQDLQNELTMTNQLLRLISVELQKIKTLTCPNGEFDATIKQNVALVEKLAHIQQINLQNLPPVKRTIVADDSNSNQEMSYEPYNASNIDNSQ